MHVYTQECVAATRYLKACLKIHYPTLALTAKHVFILLMSVALIMSSCEADNKAETMRYTQQLCLGTRAGIQPLRLDMRRLTSSAWTRAASVSWLSKVPNCL
eukprot:COSAG02_NODE_8473_length_2560_cov_15.504325_3_plen_102_part_00